MSSGNQIRLGFLNRKKRARKSDKGNKIRGFRCIGSLKGNRKIFLRREARDSEIDEAWNSSIMDREIRPSPPHTHDLSSNGFTKNPACKEIPKRASEQYNKKKCCFSCQVQRVKQFVIFAPFLKCC